MGRKDCFSPGGGGGIDNLPANLCL